MSVSKENNNWICIIDLDNYQHSYLKCLKLISWLERIEKYGFVKEQFGDEDFLEFFISRATTDNINDKNVLLTLENYIKENDLKKCKKITSAKMLLNGLDKSSNSNKFYYYLRIKNNKTDSDITNLQYLVLLLQTFPEIQHKITIRLMGMDTSQSDWTANDYFRTSHFLRFIQQKYNCFYSCYDENILSLNKLQKTTDGVQTTFLPILEVNTKICQTLNRTWLLDVDYSNQKFNELYTAIRPKECNSDNLTFELFKIGLRILFKNINGRKYNNSKKRIELLETLQELVYEVNGVTPLDIIIFGALGNVFDNNVNKDILKTYLSKIQMLSLAISQLLENIVNHSERNIGTFTFRIQNNEEYLKNNYPKYNLSDKCLELLISDSNQNDGIVQNFLNSNKADQIIKNNSDSINLANFFGDYQSEENANIWKKARENRAEMCHGLLSFANSVKELNGAFLVRSSSKEKNHSTNDLYYSCCSEKNILNQIVDKNYIPGTQFSIIIKYPLEGFNNISNSSEWAFDFNKLVYASTYKDLAKSLKFDNNVNILDYSKFIDDRLYPHNQSEKDEASTYWKDWFNSKILIEEKSNYIVYDCNLSNLCIRLIEHPELGEPFCKGFLSSNFFICSNDKKYHCILMRNPTAQFSRIFSNTLQAVSSLEFFKTDNSCVYFYPEEHSDNLVYCATTLYDLIKKDYGKSVFPFVFPLHLFLKDEVGNTLFEHELLEQADISISDIKCQGYKIRDTHMRLGNKVHLDTFYEMALFFENPNYAYYTAFLFLQNLLKYESKSLKNKRKLLFYGYASYSRALIWAIIKIMESYLNICDDGIDLDISFIIYQNDLRLESEQSQAQMYYCKEDWQRNPYTIWEPNDTNLIMIVPISSSLTTFNKMKAELNQETGKNFEPFLNYTAFWVRNNYNEIFEYLPTKEEENFWNEVDVKRRIIASELVKGKIKYLASVTSQWSSPLNCKKCFPDDVIMEFPLVETDPTSTVPTQQFYKVQDRQIETKLNSNDENDERVANLYGNVVYGHISKGNNHYQYFIKTRVYFQQEKNCVAEWLKGLREKAKDKNDPIVTSPACVNVLIIPQQIDNVEFSQYVYEYFFNGHAECVIINTEKEFRSNMMAEYSGLFNRLCAVKKPKENIKFHYIDVSIRSGNSYDRAISLMSSCMKSFAKELGIIASDEIYQFNVNKVFLLVNRLSEASKQMYVDCPSDNFNAYVDLHISAMRNFGDSCVPCKLQQEAKRYYKKSATKSISSYWENKIFDRQCIKYDLLESNSLKNHLDEDQDEGYMRMICSHRAAYHIRPIQGSSVSSYYLAIKAFFEEILYANKNSKYDLVIYKRINDSNRSEWLSAGLKVIARPFFSFDYKVRCAVMDLYIILSEHLISGCDYDNLRNRLLASESYDKKSYLIDNDNLKWIISFGDNIIKIIGSNKPESFKFIRDNILKGLADIKSNYILRKNSIIAISNYLYVSNTTQKEQEDFYDHYLRSILRMTHSSSDETKSLWLEYLLQKGVEFDSNTEETDGIEALVGLIPKKIQKAFRHFLEVLLVENNRPIYQSAIEFVKYQNENGNNCNVDLFLEENHMRNASTFLSFEHNSNIKSQLFSIAELLKLLKLNKNSHAIPNRYKSLGETIQKIVNSETKSKESIILYGRNNETKSATTEYLKLPDYFVLYPNDFDSENFRKKSLIQQNFEKSLEEILSGEVTYYLEKDGFYLKSFNGCSMYDVIIKLDNNYNDLIKNSQEKISVQKIEPMYIYIPCHLIRQQALELTRKILMFRQKLILWLENDFNNNAIAILSKQQNLAKILLTDKIGDHAENDFVECQQKLLMATDDDEFYKEKSIHRWEYTINENGEREKYYELMDDTKSPIPNDLNDARQWFLMRSYVNSRISRLYRTMIREDNDFSYSQNVNMERYYSNKGDSIMMHLAYDLETLFYAPINVGYIRKNYLRQIMKTVTFYINEIADYKLGDIDSSSSIDDIDFRMSNLGSVFKDFQFIRFENENKVYTYLSEYLVTILLDCFISALKAGEVWNQVSWGGEAFSVLKNKNAEEKCAIWISREKGVRYRNTRFDYLVISNNIYYYQRSTKRGPGMSQAAIKWYIEGIWKWYVGPNNEYPHVITEIEKDHTKYTIKLPILSSKGEKTDEQITNVN